MKGIFTFAFEFLASYCGYLFWKEEGLLLSFMYIFFFFALIGMGRSLRNTQEI